MTIDQIVIPVLIYERKDTSGGDSASGCLFGQVIRKVSAEEKKVTSHPIKSRIDGAHTCIRWP